MNTEITDARKYVGWVLYDGDCPYCLRLVEFFRGALTARRFALAPLQAPLVRERLALPEAELLTEMRLLKPDGKILGGADALLEISRAFWWAWPVWQLGRIPLMLKFFRAGYRWVARHRHCVGNTCQIHPQTAGPGNRGLDVLPLLVLPLIALTFRTKLAPWIFMWAMAFALYAGCKWLTYRQAVRTMPRPSRRLQFGYLFAWPGMNGGEFFNPQIHPPKPPASEWFFAAAKICFGACLVWSVARLVLPFHPLLAGWIGLIGIVFMLHFGLFHLLSLAWRRAGVKAVPLMQNPLWARSLADFWGVRWNTAFNELTFRLAYRPLRRWTAPAMAALAVFILSGLIHELVIPLPAHAGYGLPTFYFLIQGLGVALERSRWGQNLGLNCRPRGWLFTLLVTVGPIACLFPPPFIHHVILPMLTAIGAT